VMLNGRPVRVKSVGLVLGRKLPVFSMTRHLALAR
jgi:hypothetical protein